FKQAEFGGEISLDSRVIVEMIARQIGESAGRNAHAIEAMLIEAVRRGFKREMGYALAGKLLECTVEFDRIGRRQRPVAFTLWRPHGDRADARRLITERGPDLPGERGD